MFTKYSLSTALALSVAIFPMEQARAQDGFVGGIIGGIIGGAIANSNRPRQTTSRPAQPSVSSATREANRAVQTALNHFGWSVGTPDGAIGPRSRAAISEYQVFLGFPGTGQITEFERNILTTAHQRAIVGGPAVAQTVSTHPNGLRGLLLTVRDEMSGRPAQSAGNYGLPALVATAVDEIAASSDPSASQLVQRAGFIQLSDLNGDGRTDYILDTSVTGSAFWCSAQACTVQVFVSTPDGYVRNDFQAFNVTPAMFTCQRGNCDLSTNSAPVAVATPQAPFAPQTTTEVALSVPSAQPAARNPAAGVAAGPAVPNFFGGPSADRSLASHCNRVTLLTSANGGFTTLDKLTDPQLVLNEQFCLARSFAMAEGDTLLAQVQGITPAQVAEQCLAFAPSLQPHVAALSVQPQDEVMRSVAGFILQTGMNPQQLVSTAQICLAVGYQLDNLDVAVGAGLLLVALGEKAYGELMGHHLMQGYGAAQRSDLALAWYEHGLDANRKAVFAPNQPERDALLKAAVFGVPAAPATQVSPAAALPVFALSKP
jgi:peptidoglycan hydrolase-like protein with peptidoglycan-binding domain